MCFRSHYAIAYAELTANDSLSRDVPSSIEASLDQLISYSTCEAIANEKPNNDQHKPDKNQPNKDLPNKDQVNHDQSNKDLPNKNPQNKEQPNQDQPNKDQSNHNQPNKDQPNLGRPGHDQSIEHQNSNEQQNADDANKDQLDKEHAGPIKEKDHRSVDPEEQRRKELQKEKRQLMTSVRCILTVLDCLHDTCSRVLSMTSYFSAQFELTSLVALAAACKEKKTGATRALETLATIGLVEKSTLQRCDSIAYQRINLRMGL